MVNSASTRPPARAMPKVRTKDRRRPSPPPAPAATAPSAPARAATPVRSNPMPTQAAAAPAPRYPNAATRARIDERGSAEYNLALGDARAKAAKDYLVQVGIPTDQFSIISYGKDRPVCQEHDETCWQKNRRIHIVAMTASR